MTITNNVVIILRYIRTSIEVLTAHVFCLVVTITIVSPAFAKSPHPDLCTYDYDIQIVTLNQHDIQIEVYRPRTPNSARAIVMFHGSAGLFSTTALKTEPRNDNFGEKELARACFLVFLPHYFEVMGQESVVSTEGLITNSSLLIESANSLLAVIKQANHVAGPLYLYGESVGGFLAVQLGTTRQDITAISEVSGGLSSSATYISHPLSMLISHGIDDDIVPVASAETLRDFCRTHHIPCTLHLYAGVGHYYPESAKTRYIASTVAFFTAARSKGR